MTFVRPFKASGKHFWNDVTNHIKFVEYAAKCLKFSHPEDWYNVSYKDLVTLGGFTVLQLYNNAPANLLPFAYPSIEWHPWKFAAREFKFWLETTSHRWYFDWLAEELLLESVDDWYGVVGKDLQGRHGSNLLVAYGGSLCRALETSFPDTNWKPWLFDRAPVGFWESLNNQRQYLDWIADEFEINKPEDWYSLEKYAGADKISHLFAVYDGFSIEAIVTVYPDIPLQPWIFGQVSCKFWNSIINRRRYLDWLAEHLGISYHDEWHNVTRKMINDNGGSALLNLYGGITMKILADTYVNTQWQPWLFEHRVSPNFWEDIENCRSFVEWFADKWGYVNFEQFYQIRRHHIVENGGTTMLQYFGGSPSRLFKSLYPQFHWQFWLFEHDPEKWDGLESRKEYLAHIEQQLGIKRRVDWYLTRKTLVTQVTSLLVSNYNNSPSDMLKHVYPDTEWHPWIFDQVAPTYWTKLENQLLFMEWLRKNALELTNIQQLHSIQPQDIENYGGSGLVKQYTSLSVLLKTIYPQIEWQPWISGNRDLWTEKNMQRDFLLWFERQVASNQRTEWYDVDEQTVTSYGGGGLLRQYDGNLHKLLKTVFYTEDWHPWLFRNTIKGLWENVKTHKQYFDWLCRKFKIDDVHSQLKEEHVVLHHGRELLDNYYGGSLLEALKLLYPDPPWLFEQLTVDFWDSVANHRKYFDWLAETLSLRCIEDWYDVRQEDVMNTGGGSMLLNRYDGSRHKALASIYASTNWQGWRFMPLPRTFWDDLSNQREYLNWLEDELDVNAPEEWYYFTTEHITTLFHGHSLLRYTDGMMNLMTKHYPNFEWKESKWFEIISGSRAQILLHKAAQAVLPYGVEIEYNYASSLIKYQDTGSKMQVDIWVPQFNLGFEYQGEQHYIPSHFLKNKNAYVLDIEKRVACQEVGVSLIFVPYWWNCKQSSLGATILKYVPAAVLDPTLASLQAIPDLPPKAKEEESNVTILHL